MFVESEKQMLELRPILEHGRHGDPVGVVARIGKSYVDEKIKDSYMATEIIYKNDNWSGSYKYYFEKEASAHKSEPMPKNVLENIIYIYKLDVLVPEYLDKMQNE